MDNGNMNLTFRGQGKQLCISIDGYEFDDEHIRLSCGDCCGSDLEWLIIKVVYTYSRGTRECHSPALEAVELKSLSEKILNMIKRTRKHIMVEFIEPNLTFKFTQIDDGYSVYVKFWDEQRDQKYAIRQDMSYAELEQFRAIVEAACDKYCNRVVKM